MVLTTYTLSSSKSYQDTALQESRVSSDFFYALKYISPIFVSRNDPWLSISIAYILYNHGNFSTLFYHIKQIAEVIKLMLIQATYLL